MTKYRVHTDRTESEEFHEFEKADELYESWKDDKMSEGVTEDSYVEIVASDDDFEDHRIIKRAVAVVDNDRNELGTPREEGMDWDYWAKWEESVPCEFEVTKDIYWDDWGRIVKVFRKGDICQGILYPSGNVSAESTIYKGISDSVDLDSIVIRK